MSIIDDLNSLSPEELEKVGNLINKFASRKENKEAPEKLQKNRRKFSNNKKRVDADEFSERPSESIGRKNRRRRVVLDENEPEEPVSRRRRGTTKQRKRGGKKGTMARTEAVSLTGENKFLKDRDRNKYKSDVQTDKLLWGNNLPTERPDKFEYIEAECMGCGYFFDVHPSLVYRDEDTHEIVFTCDDCSSSRGRGRSE